VTRAGHALFFRLHDCAFALLGEALCACGFAHFFALNFALLRLRFRAPTLLDFSRSLFELLNFWRFLPRSSIFCARTLALLDFRARNFVLVRLYTARTGEPGQYTQDRTGRTGQLEQDSQNRTARKGQQEQDRPYKTALTGEPGQDSQDMKARTGQAGTRRAEQERQNRTDRQNRTGKTGQSKHDKPGRLG
jgi:hypothetical protein